MRSPVLLPPLLLVPLVVEFWRLSRLRRRPKFGTSSKPIVKSPCSPQVDVGLAVAVVAVLFREVDDARLERGVVKKLLVLEVVDLDCSVLTVLWLDTTLDAVLELIAVELDDGRGITVTVVTDLVENGGVELLVAEETPDESGDAIDDAVVPVSLDRLEMPGLAVPEDREVTAEDEM